MTMRSMPPASSHLADRPVPAPPPINGWPAAILARKRSSSSDLAMRGIRASERAWLRARRDFAPGGNERVDEGFVVDVLRQPHELAIGAAAKSLLEGREQRAVRLGVVERLAGLVDRRDAAFRDEEAHRAGHRIELVGEEHADRAALVG